MLFSEKKKLAALLFACVLRMSRSLPVSGLCLSLLVAACRCLSLPVFAFSFILIFVVVGFVRVHLTHKFQAKLKSAGLDSVTVCSFVLFVESSQNLATCTAPTTTKTTHLHLTNWIQFSSLSAPLYIFIYIYIYTYLCMCEHMYTLKLTLSRHHFHRQQQN